MDFMRFPTLTQDEERLPLYLVGLGHWDNQEPIARPQGFPHYQWLHCHAGEGLYKDRLHQSFAIRAGHGLFIPPHTPHEYTPSVEPWDVSWVTFNGAQAEALVRAAGLTESVPCFIHEPGPISEHAAMKRLLYSGDPFAALECSKVLYMLLLDLNRHLAPDRSFVPPPHSRLRPVFELVQHHYHRTITLDEMAGAIGVTPQHLCQLFKQTVRLRPIEYVNRERIKKSKEIMLLNSGIRMREVARQVGFEQPSYFNALFKKLEGMTPAAFKQLHGGR